MSLVFIIISAVALAVAYICIGIAVAFSVREARNTDGEHWWDFAEYVMEYGWQCFVAMVGAVVAITAMLISCIC